MPDVNRLTTWFRKTRLHAWGEGTTKKKWVVPAYLILALTLWLGVASNRANDEADRRQDKAAAALALAQNAERDALVSYSDCARRVATRSDLRNVLIEIVGLWPPRDDTRKILELIDSRYPALILNAECGVPPVPASSSGGG